MGLVRMMTAKQFEILKQLDDNEQLHLVDEEIRKQYLELLRYIQIKKAGIPILEKKESK
jgi:hypothetical protein